MNFFRVAPILWIALSLAACGADSSRADATLDAGADMASSQDLPDAPADVASGPIRLVVMTFNVRTAWGSDGVNAWDNRRELALKVIHTTAPDILGTQEALLSQVDDLSAGLPGFDHVGRLRSDSPFDETNTIFFRADRFELLADDSFQLSDTPDVIGSTFSENQGNPRIVTWVRLRQRASGREFMVFNTHWDTASVDDIPLRSAALTASRVTSIRAGLPAVLSGDFNSTPGSEPWNVLAGVSEYNAVRGDLIDPWVELGLPEQGTSHGFTGVAKRRIDNVFHVPGVVAIRGEVILDHEDAVYPSDHFPVVVEVEF
jgi:endonuclease/exonuclease/phosphatase family metal-dependent hydrolase